MAADLERDCDVVLRGAGPIGQNAAERARAAALSVAPVERELVGGECSCWACVPGKALLRPVIAVSDRSVVARRAGFPTISEPWLRLREAYRDSMAHDD